jgi:hypothetical protein
MAEFGRDEVEAAFRHNYLTGPVHEDWVAWSQLFTDDGVYADHFYGRFRGPAEIQRYVEATMGAAPHVYAALVWYNIDGSHVVYEVMNRADNPEPGGPTIEFPSLQVLRYAGDNKWSSQEDWWILYEMKKFNAAYQEARRLHDPDHSGKMSRLDFGDWVDWARPEPGHAVSPSWLGRDDVDVITSIRDLTFGERVS